MAEELILDPESTNLPKRSQLPRIPGAPEGAAWFWGKNDELGRLNMLTLKRRQNAAKLISTGETINLDWRADLPNPPSFGREPFEHKIKNLGPAGNDDLWSMNTQSGSQWDGYRHVSAKNGENWIFYNNLTQHEIENTTRMGLQAWAKFGIVGRGVLIDYWSYARDNNKLYDPNTTYPISLSELMACAKSQGTTFEYGDILMIRSGFIDNYNRLEQKGREEMMKISPLQQRYVGVEVSEEMLDFLHDNYFAAVVGDAPAFESWPSPYDWNHHVYLLPRWGCPIGEMWDLEELSETCKKHGRYHFFMSSSPANVLGGVGSHPNAMAIF